MWNFFVFQYLKQFYSQCMYIKNGVWQMIELVRQGDTFKLFGRREGKRMLSLEVCMLFGGRELIY